MLDGRGVEPVLGSLRCGGSGSLAPRVNCGLDPYWRVFGLGGLPRGGAQRLPFRRRSIRAGPELLPQGGGMRRGYPLPLRRPR